MAEVDISTVKAQQGFKTLAQETEVLRKRMFTLAKELDKNRAVANSLSNVFLGKLTPAEKKIVAVTKQAEAAFVRQAKATNTAREKVKNLAAALKLAGATQQQQGFILRSVNQQLKRFDKEMSSGVRSARQFQAAQDRLNRTLGIGNRNLRVINAAQKKQARTARDAKNKNDRLSATLRNLGSSAVFAVGPLSGIGARITALGAIAVRTGVKIALFAAGLVAAGVAAFKLIGGALRAAIAFQKIESALVVATGSLVGAKDAFAFVSDISLKLGLNLEQAADQFAQLAAAAKGTSLEGAGVRSLFASTAKASVALGLSVDQTTGIFRAFQQIISKGTVQSEELRGQLGERLPGAFQLAAIAMGVTTKELGKMLELGQVLADDLLPKLGAEFEKRFAKQALEASKNLRAGINRLSSSTFLFSLELDNTIKSSQVAAGFLDNLSNTVRFLTKNLVSLIAQVGGAAVGLATLAVPAIIGGLVKLAGVIKGVAASVLGLGAAMATGPLGLVALFVRLAIAAGASLATFAFLSDGLKETADSQEELSRHLGNYIDLVKEAEGATKSAINAQIALAEKGVRAIKLELEALSAVLGNRPLAELKELGKLEQFLIFTPIIRDVTNFFRSLGADTTVEETKARMKALVEQLEEFANKIEELKTLPEVSLGAAAAKQEITDLIEELEVLNKVKAALARGDLIAAKRIPAEAEARKLVKDIPVQDLQAEIERLGLPDVDLSELSNRFTSEGREFIKTVEGISSEITITTDKIKGSIGKFVNIPTVFGGQVVSEEEAVKRISATGGVDPETGKLLESFDTIEQAQAAAELRSKSLGLELDRLFAGPRRDIITQKVTGLNVAIEKTGAANKKSRKELEAAPEAVRRLNLQVANLVAQSKALKAGPEAIREFEATLREQKTLKAYTKAIEGLDEASKKLIPTYKEFKAAVEGVRLGKLTAKVDEQIAAMKSSNEVLKLRIAGLKEEADALEIRNKLEAEFGKEIKDDKIKQLRTELELGKKLTEEFKLQQAAEKEAARLAADLSKVIGTAFEDAIIKGDDFRSVLKGILDDISRIILRSTVTKPFETFLTKQLDDSDALSFLTGSSSAPSGPGPGTGPEVRSATNLTALGQSAAGAATTVSSLGTAGVTATTALQSTATSLTGALAGGLTAQTTGALNAATGLNAVGVAAQAAAASLSTLSTSKGSSVGGSVLGGVLGLFTGGSSSGPGALSLSDPGFAHGGRPPANTPSIVGENGPELFVPGVPGTIVSNADLAKLLSGAGQETQAPAPPNQGNISAGQGAKNAGAFTNPFTATIALALAFFNKKDLTIAGNLGNLDAPTLGGLPNPKGFAESFGSPGGAGPSGAGAASGDPDSSGAGAGAGPGEGGQGVGSGVGGAPGGTAGVGSGNGGSSDGASADAGPDAGAGGPGTGFRHGGRPPIGRSSVVGEAGPELFIPDSFRGGGQGGPINISVNQRFDFRGASIEAVALLRQESTRIKNETLAEARRARTRGGR